MIRFLLLLTLLVLFSKTIHAQKVWTQKLVVFKQFNTNGEIPFYVQSIDSKDSFAVYGIFDSARIYNDKGDQIASVPHLFNTLKKNGTSWQSAGDVHFTKDDRSMALFHNTIKGVDYISTYGYQSPPYFQKLNPVTNTYGGVPELDFYQYSRTLRFYDWGTNIIFIGDFSYLNSQPYQTVALWNPQTNVISQVGGTPVNGNSVTNISISPTDSTIGFTLYDSYRIIRKGETSFATGYPPFPKANALIEVATKDNIYASFNSTDPSKGSEVYHYTTATNAWQKIISLTTNANSNTTPKVESLLYANGTLYIGGQFDSANGSSRFHIIQYTESTGITANAGNNQMGNITGCSMDGIHLAMNNNILYGFANSCIVFGVQAVYYLRETNTVLPLSLITFSAKKNGKENSLFWKTAQEMHTSAFEIERGTDGQHFTALGKVAAKGTQNSETMYDYTDANPIGDISYYRLKILDNDGSSTYSSIKSIKNNEGLLVMLYSNVVHATLVAEFTAEKKEQLTVRLVDVHGRILQCRGVSIAYGTSTETIPTATLQNGTYYLQALSSSTVKTLKFMKQ